LEWRNQINRYLSILKNTPESIGSEATDIEALMNYHRFHGTEVEEKFGDINFTGP
jgi:hypothetical protein